MLGSTIQVADPRMMDQEVSFFGCECLLISLNHCLGATSYGLKVNILAGCF